MQSTEDCCCKSLLRANSLLRKCGVQKIFLPTLPFLLPNPSGALILNSLFRKAWAGRNSFSESPLRVMLCFLNAQVKLLEPQCNISTYFTSPFIVSIWVSLTLYFIFLSCSSSLYVLPPLQPQSLSVSCGLT